MMTKKFGKVVHVNSNFYVKVRNSKFEISKSAKIVKIDGFEDFDFFIHKDKIGFWSVYEPITGCRVTKIYKELKKALSELKKILNKLNKSKLELIILKSLIYKRLSPRYRYLVNPSKIR